MDCNEQLIHCARTGMCLSDLFLVLWWVTLKRVWTLCRGNAGIPDSIFEVARVKKACRKPHVAKDALTCVNPRGTFLLPTHVCLSASDLSRCAQFPMILFPVGSQVPPALQQALPMLRALQPCAGLSTYNCQYLPFSSPNINH